jgi:hypothetical protein
MIKINMNLPPHFLMSHEWVNPTRQIKTALRKTNEYHGHHSKPAIPELRERIILPRAIADRASDGTYCISSCGGLVGAPAADTTEEKLDRNKQERAKKCFVLYRVIRNM